MFTPCLLIPVYNHGTLLEATWSRLAPLGLPCILVDDGSDQATAEVLGRLAAGSPNVHLIRRVTNGGKGVAVLDGLALALQLGFTHALQIDADGQHDTGDIPQMLALAKQHPDALISGAPQYGPDIPKARLYGRYITHAWVWLETLSFDIRDSMCGFRVYPVAASCRLAAREAVGQRMDFDTDIMVRLYWAGIPVHFLPTHVTYPADGISHFDAWRDNLRISRMHTRLVCGMLARLPALLARRSTRSTHWAAQPERGSAWGIRFSLWCYRLFGRNTLHWLLYPITAWFFLFARSAKRASAHYLCRVFGRPPTSGEQYRHFLSFSRAIVDRLEAWSGQTPPDAVQFPERQLLVKQAQTGTGAIILTAHLGNPDMCRALIQSMHGVKLNVLVFHQHAARITQTLYATRPGMALEIIPIQQIGPDTAMHLYNKIQHGEFVVLAADRTSPQAAHRSSLADFLGEQAAFPQGPFILAALLECPVYLLFVLQQGTGHTLHLEHFAERITLPRRTRRAALDQWAQAYADRLAHYCRLAPLQWFNFYDFWQPIPDNNDQAPVV